MLADNVISYLFNFNELELNHSNTINKANEWLILNQLELNDIKMQKKIFTTNHLIIKCNLVQYIKIEMASQN